MKPSRCWTGVSAYCCPCLWQASIHWRSRKKSSASGINEDQSCASRPGTLKRRVQNRRCFPSLFAKERSTVACRGVFFALTPAQTEHLLSLSGDERRVEYIQNEIEQTWDEARGGNLTVGRSSSPLGTLILGGIPLYSDQQRYISNLAESSELPEVSAELSFRIPDRENPHAIAPLPATSALPPALPRLPIPRFLFASLLRSRDRHILQLHSFARTLQQQSSPAHVAAPQKLLRKHQPLTKHL
jgi:hypothetical protein